MQAIYVISPNFWMPSPIPSTSIPAKEEWGGNVCVLTYDALDVDAITRSVGDDRAGATVTFIGTTRNSFRGKVVTRLEYQAYSKLAIRSMVEIVRNVTTSDSAPSLISCAVHHRLGTVPVGEASIVIAVSSPHRKEAFVACEQILEEVKQGTQIWKREYYDGEDEERAEWKTNYS